MRDFVKAQSNLEKPDFLRSFPHPFLLQLAHLPSKNQDDYFTMAADSSVEIAKQSDYLLCPLFLIKKTASTSFQRMIMVGRTKNNDIVLPFSVVSKFHCHFGQVRENWYIEDSGSSNGTFIRARQIEATKRELLDGCVEISFGKSLSFLFLSSEKMYDYTQGLASMIH
ncbi:MAG: FHA domain-containing protein [Planctomycetota bacterium]|nr:FHA domain-containing protein [Planctomycetota bacterium]